MPMKAPSPCVALFDLDGTLTYRDTLQGFLTGYLWRHPVRGVRLWRLTGALLRYLFDRDRGELKSAAIKTIMGGDSREAVDEWADLFVAALRPRGAFRPAALAALEAHRAAGDHLVLLSASPDLYVPRIGRSLGFERTVCTEIAWSGDRLDGKLITQNRHGEEKSRCLSRLRLLYPHLEVMAYGNSASDLPHLHQAERALLVNADGPARRRAAEVGVPVGDWS